MRKLLSVFFAILLGGSSAMAESLVLKLGDDHKIPIPSNHRVWVQNRKFLNIATRGGFVVISGKAEGSTTLQVGNKTFLVQVIQPLKKNLLQNFEKETRGILGLRIQMVKSQVTVTGKLYRWEDWQRLAEISDETGVNYAMAAEISPHLQARAVSYWQQQFAETGLTPLPVHFARPLQARSAVDPLLFAKYEDILGRFGVSVEKDKAALDLAPVVKVQITVAEVNRDFNQTYGIKWPPTFSAKLMPEGKLVNDQAPFEGTFFESHGYGKILASPNLVCRSGKEAEFLAGGEFPIKLMNYKMQDVVWKKYGVLLKVKPKADTSGRMSIAIETEVSTIDGSRVVDGIPGMITHRVSSHFDLSKPQTIILSGLLKNENGNNSQGLLGLSRLPILGALFGSKDFKDNRSELVIFVRPTILREDAPLDANTKPQHLGDLSND